MSKVCPLTGKKAQTGYNVSHSQRHTKKRWQPNLVMVTLRDEHGRTKRLRISTHALRIMNKAPRIRTLSS